MATVAAIPGKVERRSVADIGFAVGIIVILTVLFLPLPAILIDIGLAFSIAFSVLILMVSLWIHRPLEFSAFPTVLLIVTLLRLSLNVATTRLILSNGAQGHDAAGHVIAGFANFVMGGDFVIGTVVFVILITVNFLVITKGATRIAEVGARFTLDAIPGKQMAIDADLSAGNIDEKEAMRRRRELEEESAFFGSMDGASKFVRGDAIAGIIITAVNVFGGIIIGVTRHDMDPRSRGGRVRPTVGRRWSRYADSGTHHLAGRRPSRLEGRNARLGRDGDHGPARELSPCALRRRHGDVRSGACSWPSVPTVCGARRRSCFSSPRRSRSGSLSSRPRKQQSLRAAERKTDEESRQSVKEQLKTAEVEICLGKQLSTSLLASHGELAHRVARMRRAFAKQYGFVVPEIKITDDITIPTKAYQIKIYGTIVASEELRIGDMLVITGEGPVPDVPFDEGREPAFGMKAVWIAEMFANNVKREGFNPIDPMSVMLTHLREVIRGNLSQLLSYKDMRLLVDRLEPEYRRLVDEIIPVAAFVFRASRPCSSCCWQSASRSAICISSSKALPRWRRTCAAPSSFRSTCACAWRSKSAAIFRRTARSRCCASATAGMWRSIKVSSATQKATWWSSTSIPGSSSSSALRPRR